MAARRRAGQQPLPAERYRRIQELLQERQVVRVAALAELLGVSELTIRRDLQALERRGILERTHGGAVMVQRMRTDLRYVEAVGAHPQEKRAIGRAAAALVAPGDTIFLNGGTTTLEVFRHLAAPGVRVITNHVGVALEAVDRDVELILLGGHFRAASLSAVGPFATDALRRVHADKAFIGVEGISLVSGITTPSAQEAEIARLMIQRTRGPVTIVADHSKLGRVADFVIAPLDEVDRLVVDAGISPAYREQLLAAGVELVIADGEIATAEAPRG